MLYCCVGKGPEDPFYGDRGVIFHELQRESGAELDFVSFGQGALQGDSEERFIEECSNAEIVIVDAWNYPMGESGEDAQESMAQIVRRVLQRNPGARAFALLMESHYKVAVHQYAEPIQDYASQEVVLAIKTCVGKDSHPDILVFDDSAIHRRAARDQLSENFNVVTVQTYDQAEALIQQGRFKIVLMDLFVLASDKAQGPKGQRFVGQEMPITPFLMLLALKNGAEKIGLLTDAGHHDHPASACIDAFGSQPFNIGGARVVLSNRDITYAGEIRVKDWKSLLAKLD
ncbi:MAG TPA: hypothetical protein P5328_01545 [Candidatus Paceibacterota bacterium]|nr:hypothetical protein [Candidatus Paceibacterota bacterium]HRZ34681.1 hypothetical protein [Candidatus Paceibacterota bacterium]